METAFETNTRIVEDLVLRRGREVDAACLAVVRRYWQRIPWVGNSLKAFFDRHAEDIDREAEALATAFHLQHETEHEPEDWDDTYLNLRYTMKRSRTENQFLKNWELIHRQELLRRRLLRQSVSLSKKTMEALEKLKSAGPDAATRTGMYDLDF